MKRCKRQPQDAGFTTRKKQVSACIAFLALKVFLETIKIYFEDCYKSKVTGVRNGAPGSRPIIIYLCSWFSMSKSSSLYQCLQYISNLKPDEVTVSSSSWNPRLAFTAEREDDEEAGGKGSLWAARTIELTICEETKIHFLFMTQPNHQDLQARRIGRGQDREFTEFTEFYRVSESLQSFAIYREFTEFTEIYRGQRAVYSVLLSSDCVISDFLLTFLLLFV